MNGTCTLVFNQKPPTANEQRGKQSRYDTARQTKTWRKMGKDLALEAINCHSLPAQVDSISVEIRQLAKDRRWHQDIGACMPAWKAIEDGLVDAQLIPDDTAEHVTRVTFVPCKIVGFAGLQVDITWTKDTP